VDDNAYNSDDVLTGILFDGTLLQSGLQDIAIAIKAMPRFKVDRGASLSELDVLQTWDTLNLIWVKTVRRFLCSDSDVALPVSLGFLLTRHTADPSIRAICCTFGSLYYWCTLNSPKNVVISLPPKFTLINSRRL
jgi:hypothetical protein